MKTKTAPKRKSPNDYAKLSFRPGSDLAARLEAMKDKTGMSIGQIVTACLNGHLPTIEARHARRA